MQETQKMQAQYLGGEDPLEQGVATHPVLLPGESYRHRSLVGYSPWGGKQPDSGKQLSATQFW